MEIHYISFYCHTIVILFIIIESVFARMDCRCVEMMGHEAYHYLTDSTTVHVPDIKPHDLTE